MGEIFHALEVLNRSMKLGLTGKQLLRAEMGFKSALAMQGNPDPTAQRLAGDPVALAEQFELTATLKPRAQKLSLNELSTLAGKAVTTPIRKVDAATFRRIDQAMAVSPATAVKATTVATKASVAKAAVKTPKST